MYTVSVSYCDCNNSSDYGYHHDHGDDDVDDDDYTVLQAKFFLLFCLFTVHKNKMTQTTGNEMY